MGEVASLASNWLDLNDADAWYAQAEQPLCFSIEASDSVSSASLTTSYNPTETTHYVTPAYSYYYHDTYWWPTLQKVRLKMSEVETLRRAAKKDKALKKVLEKIGPHIEVEVDFG